MDLGSYRSVRSSLSSKRVVFSVTLGRFANSAVVGRGCQLLGARAGGGGNAGFCACGANCGGACIGPGGPYMRAGFGAPSSKTAAYNIRNGPPIKQMIATRAASISGKEVPRE